VTFVKTYHDSSSAKYEQFNLKEISRYAGGLKDEKLILSCLEEVSNKLVYKVCYRKFSLKTNGSTLDMDFTQVASADLAKTLQNCDGIILFAATVGIEIDRLIFKYGKISPLKALVFQAIGAERIEWLCNQFCKDLAKDENVTPRFSPGYGDLPLEVQKDIFSALNCEKNIGLTLNDSMLMSPTKSVTAFVGIKN